MKYFVAVLVLLCSGVVMSSNDITKQQRFGDDQSLKNEIQAEVQETEGTVPNQKMCQTDIQTLLRELSVKLAEQSVELRYTKSQMTAVEKQLEELKKQNEASEKQVEELKKQNEAQNQELGTLQRRSNITENHIRELNRENGYKIAFSASLSTSASEVMIGPFSTQVTLKYTNVFVNTGKAYNPNTGLFTAPVRGVYTFIYSITGYGSNSVPVGARLFKNGQHVVIAYCKQESSLRLSTTNGASLLLEVGDVVYVQLYVKSQIVDNGHFYNTFSGHMLFTV